MKKIITFSVSLFVFISFSFGQLVAPGAAVGNSFSPNVGIGLISPTSILHVQGNDVLFETMNPSMGTNFRMGFNNSIVNSFHSGALGEMNNVNNTMGSFALGSYHVIDGGDQSGIIGEANTIMNGHGSVSLGGHNYQDGGYTFAIGRALNVTGGVNIAMGSDVVNSISNSLMVGFNSPSPTFFVGPSSSLGTTAVGIGGITNPAEMLHVNGRIRASSLAGGGNVCADAQGNLILSGPCGGSTPPDNLGNHTATMPLNMACNDIVNAGNISFCNGTFLDQSMPGELMLGGALIITGPAGSTGFELFVNGRANAPGGWWTISDQRYKKNIQKIESASNVLNKLNGYGYNYDQDKYPELKLPKGKVYGFMAQEVEEILPAAVSQNDAGMYTVNYDMVIPFLTEALKEQQAELLEVKAELQAQQRNSEETAQLKAELEELKAAVRSICNEGCGDLGRLNNSIENTAPTYWEDIELKQNSPNPFNGNTSIKYYLPSEVQRAALAVYDLQGKQLRTYPIDGTGQGSVEIAADDLPSGMYLYNLIVDGQASLSLKMILTEGID